jgi:hypothetical protein
MSIFEVTVTQKLKIIVDAETPTEAAEQAVKFVKTATSGLIKYEPLNLSSSVPLQKVQSSS